MNVLPERMLLLFLLSVVPIFTDVAESKADVPLHRGDLADNKGSSLEIWQQADLSEAYSYNLASELNDDKKTDSPSGWFGVCQDLTDDLEKSWNLTVRVSERTVAVAWNMGGVLYDLINCKATVLLPISCIFNNLSRLRQIVNPAIVEAYGFIKEGVALVPVVVKDTRDCYNF
ncbi:hypothetical protein GE061_005955 [Apolygus lucorum]|uniref:Uncharacterized protein n=1 Tax=Apolygus lucorum TaxID=248454 RepID=A0A8S9WSL1_APOLU|nr:hypothetical protein GE061_005955 [Apolygus lucorum]